MGFGDARKEEKERGRCFGGYLNDLGSIRGISGNNPRLRNHPVLGMLQIIESQFPFPSSHQFI